VFLSHTSDLVPFVAAATSAITRSRSAIVEMGYFPATDAPPARYCRQRVEEADVLVLLAGSRYGSRVRNRPDLSYTELAFRRRLRGAGGIVPEFSTPAGISTA
jgi:Domain of unknown function (DUF4062)